jgi:2-polyprenyl-6-methoxyphenol hydroxylase-like FAD-dependent oxidoreductase
MKILISGGGIAGLTLGLAAKKAGHVPLILEQRNTINTPSFGGGIGLWPPSQMVMERLGLLDSL